MNEFYTISLRVEKAIPGFSVEQAKGDWLFLSPNIRLSNHKGAHIESRDLAEEFLQCCRPIFDKRYGEGKYEACIGTGGGSGKHLAEKIKKESDIIRTRIATGNFSPNK